MSLLAAENLKKTYKIGDVEVRALQGVSLSIEAGEFVAIMGPSGSGKSTLMHLLGFLDVPDSGQIRLLGKTITDLSPDACAYLRNRVIGFIFQQFNLMARSTALENVCLPLLYKHTEPEAAGLQRARKLLSRVGLEQRIAHKPNELSGGQQQRVAIARALVNEPLVILADEPTGNLDSQSGKEIMDVFKTLHAQGMTIVIVTHDERIGQEAERVIRMHDGKIAGDERKAKPKPSKLPGADVEIRPNIPKAYTLKEFQENFSQAMRMILSNKLRSFLSMLGVLIGVGCVITMLALGRGASESIKEELSRLGSNLLSIRPGSVKVRGVAAEAGAVTRLTLEDAKAIEDLPSIKKVAPQVTNSAQLVYGDKNWISQVIGTTPEYAAMKNQEPVQGRFFTEDENIRRQRVVLIGQTVVQALFNSIDPVGKVIKINRINFQVIGVLPLMGSNTFRDNNDVVIIPLQTAMRRLMGKDYLNMIDAEVASPEEMNHAQEEITQLIIRRHRLPPDRYDTFNIRNLADLQAALSSTTKTFSILLGCVAVISLVVGGIGIMNIMLVSVKERTREIGLRKAIGATPRDILMQFLVESVLITFMGGAAGILLAVIVSWSISVLAQWKTVITLASIILAFVFSVAVGIIFGLWPAKQASELEPIQSLRYE